MAHTKVEFEPYVYSLDRRKYIVCGADEVGRGPLVGPVVAACVVLDLNRPIAGLADSKQLSEKKRDALYPLIVENALAYGIGMCSAQEIDSMNILNASLEAMVRAYRAMGMPIDCNLMLVDGNKTPKNLPFAVEAVVKGDARVEEIMAASILAKVTRDKMLEALDKRYSAYGFASHKGYPTKAHLEKLQTLPLLDCYRMTYKPIANLLANGAQVVHCDFDFVCGF